MVGSQPLQSPSSKGEESLHNSEFGFEELSFSIADSFLNFEFIKDWIEENPEPYKSMASDLREDTVGLSSEKVEVQMLDERPEMDPAGFGDKIKNEDGLVGEEVGNLGSLRPSSQENVEFVGIGKGSEMGCQSSSGIIKVKDEVELGNSGCLVEEGMGKVSLDGEMNDLVSAFGGMNGIKQNGEGSGDGIGGGVIDGCDVAKSVEVSGVNGNDVESGSVVGFAGEDANINEIMILDDNGKMGDKKGKDGDKGDDGSESESKTHSSSSSTSEGVSDSESESESESSSDDDEEEGDRKGKLGNEVRETGRKEVNGHKDVEMEEGEIVSSDPEEIVAWSGDEYDEEDDSGVISMGPPRSKNELAVLPPVPPVNVTLEPHHQILPIGAVLSVIGAQVIVEGVEKHNPLNEGSILWISESRSPLGVVDEIFGPVKNPYYIVRYNSESEVPAGIQPGTSISFVPEFANHVLNDKNLYQKGYDASGANDEEILEDEEFSDDEKEAEYRKMLKNKKRGTNDAKVGNQRKDEKKFGNRSRNWKYDPTAKTQEPVEETKQHSDPSRHHKPLTNNLSLNQSQSLPSGPGQGLACQQELVPPFAQLASSAGFSTYSGGANGIPFQQPQNVGLPQMPTNGMPLVPQILPQQLFQMPPENRFPFQQQIIATPNLPSNLVLPGCQPAGFGAGPAFLPWPACMGQNPFMGSPFGMGAPMQEASLPINAGQQAAPSNISPIQQVSIPLNAGQAAPLNAYDSQQRPTTFSSKPDTSQSFFHGKRYGGGSKPHPHRRGGGRFRGGRGGRSSG